MDLDKIDATTQEQTLMMLIFIFDSLISLERQYGYFISQILDSHKLHHKLVFLLAKPNSSLIQRVAKLSGKMCFSFDHEVKNFIEAGIVDTIIYQLTCGVDS